MPLLNIDKIGTTPHEETFDAADILVIQNLG